ncbi:glycine--tRNA ligase [Gemmatimonadota bacterium]
MAVNERSEVMDRLASLSKRKGFIFQSSEVYGGLGSTWDYGPLGVELKRAVKDRWWEDIVSRREDVEGMDAAILMNPKVWEASGHVGSFQDPLVECSQCQRRFRQDHVEGDVCPECGGELGEPRMFNLMFKTFIGPVEDDTAVVYLRPETAQGIFVNFRNVQEASRQKIPFGIAQLGKAFRNEITVGNFIFRSREFEQMELEWFCHPDETERWFEYWVQARLDWYKSLGLAPERLRLRPHEEEELAHYARACHDVEYEFPFGWSELEGIADRGTYDLDQHIQHSGKDIRYLDPHSHERYVPAVVEASAGVDRTVLTVLADAYDEDVVEGEERALLRFAPHMAPIKAAVFPLVKRDGMPETARAITEDLRREAIKAVYDEGGSIGRRYRRMDEVGTPFCITVDGQTAEDQTVTIRERDSLEQIRVSTDKVTAYVAERIRG